MGDNRFTLGGILILAFLIGWLAGLKNLVLEQTASAEAENAAPRPNVLLIVADDLGYNDTDAINPEGLHTPHITELARGGVTFRRHYADATCTPSRVGILTGRDPERSGFRPVGSEIPAEYTTLAEALRAQGYATYLTGKWHAGEERLAGWPRNKGFDGWFGFLNQWETAGPVTEANKGVRKPTYNNP
ncbi:MAG: sulfatase-like hydrolase/transferase, partial [Halioglobus sp.]|nr:sulfatase-like hydrolase/transferase [Halioglobus sp.]